MTIAKFRNIKNIRILGDSKCVIDGLNGVARLEVLNLCTWKLKIGEIRGYFQEIHFQHIYREFNDCVGRLSKSALSLEPGHIQIEELLGDQIQNSFHTYIEHMEHLPTILQD